MGVAEEMVRFNECFGGLGIIVFGLSNLQSIMLGYKSHGKRRLKIAD